MNCKEQELFLLLCDFNKCDKERIKSLLPDNATPEVLGHLFFNRMAGVAYGVLKESDTLDRVNREFRNSLYSAYDYNSSKNISFFICLKELSKILKKHEGKYAMLKGALLCALYPEGYRISNDIDLLVRPSDVTVIGNSLREFGFKQGKIKNGNFVEATRSEIIESRMTRGETVPYIMEVNLPYMRYFEVDINFSLDYKNSDYSVIDTLLNRVEKQNIHNIKITTLDKYDFFIHLCCHLYKEATTFPWVKMQRDMTMYKFCDIRMLVDSFDKKEMKKIFSRAFEVSAVDACSCAILWTSNLFKLDNDYAIKIAEEHVASNKGLLHRVVSPSEHKMFLYKTKDIKARFFANNRIDLLEER